MTISRGKIMTKSKETGGSGRDGAGNTKTKTDDALAKELTKRHASGLDEALAGEEGDGGESVLGGAPREGEAKHVDQASKEKADRK